MTSFQDSIFINVMNFGRLMPAPRLRNRHHNGLDWDSGSGPGATSDTAR
jgi:hypothetical protein